LRDRRRHVGDCNCTGFSVLKNLLHRDRRRETITDLQLPSQLPM
jgi:hypothetical protein